MSTTITKSVYTATHKLFKNQDTARIRTGWRLIVCLWLFLTGFVISILLIEASFKDGLITDTLSVFGLLASALVAVGVTAKYLENRSLSYYGLNFTKESWLNLAVGVVIGTLIPAGILATYLILGWASIEGFIDTPTASTYSFPTILVISIGLIAAISIGEELLIRGYIMQNLAETAQRLPQVLILLVAWGGSAVIFAWFHNANIEMWYEAVHFITGGLLLGLPVLFDADLSMPIGIHFAYNYGLAFIFGLRDDSALIIVDITSTSAWTGMAGLTETIAVLAAGIPVIIWIYWRSDKLSFAAPFTRQETTE